MSEHVCKCRECRPEEFPEMPINTQGYWGVETLPRESWPKHIFCDGVEMHLVHHALSGEDGWVFQYVNRETGTPKAHLCSCRHGACEEVRYGRVEFDK